VIDERTYTVEPKGESACYIHDMVLDAPAATPDNLPTSRG